MEIIKIHYKVSKPVSRFREIKAEVERIKKFMINPNNFKGYYNKPFAIAHCQVSETPLAFFVVSPECVSEKMFESRVIINPEIEEAPLFKATAVLNGKGIPNVIEYHEPCMSFPYRKPKRIIRYDKIVVSYEIPGKIFGLKTVRKELQGIPSQIFQHFYDHIQAKNIFFESEKPVKWWELLGKEKSKGGTSIDPADSLGLERQKERSIDGDKLNPYAKLRGNQPGN